MATQAQKQRVATRSRNPAICPEPPGVKRDQAAKRRSERVHLTAEETRARMEAFATEREEAFVAAIRKDKD